MAAAFQPDDVRSKYKGMTVAIGGPPHSGKSVLLAELYRQLLSRRPSGVFLQRACPDGEGMWSAESDPDLVREIRRKGSFSQEFVLFTLRSIENLGRRFPILLLDLGGRKTAENAEILHRSTHILVLSSDEAEDEGWIKFAGEEGCKTLAVLRSRLFELAPGVLDTTKRTPDQPWLGEVPLRGELWQLDRKGPPELYREAVSRFAEWLIAQVESR
jgi:CRISPR-associated protein Csx3